MFVSGGSTVDIRGLPKDNFPCYIVAHVMFFFILQLIYQLRKTTDVFNEKSEFGQIGSLCKRGTDNIQRVRKLSVAKQMLTGLF